LYIDSIVNNLSKQMGKDRILKNAPMNEHTSFKAGGKAKLLIIPESIVQLRCAIEVIKEFEVPFYIMGKGTNILVRDGGYDGVIIKISKGIDKITVLQDRIVAEAGALLKNVSQKAVESGLSGFEFASGIPGSIGGAAFMNAGAYDSDMANVVEKVHVLDAKNLHLFHLTKEEMQYGYRSSRLMRDEDIVISVSIKLVPSDKVDIIAKISDYDSRRKEKQPLSFPSGGSFFKRPKGNYAGALIEGAGLKGKRIGGAMVSDLHAGFLINAGGATADDILRLMKLVQDKVYEKYEIKLEPEIRIIGREKG
jgi:UDP-N-acetylmuramate dehydrogenase